MPTSKVTNKFNSTASNNHVGSHAKRSDKSNISPDAIQLLLDDHKAIQKLFKAYDEMVNDKKAAGVEKQSLAQKICSMLTIHMAIEEEIFYLAAQEALKEPDLLEEAAVEHVSAKALISQIESMRPDEAFFDAKVIVLSHYIDRHFKEEEADMFPKARQAQMELGQLGDEMSVRKDELMADMKDRPVH